VLIPTVTLPKRTSSMGRLLSFLTAGALMAIPAASAQAWPWSNQHEYINATGVNLAPGTSATLKVDCPTRVGSSTGYPTITGGGFFNRYWGLEIGQSNPFLDTNSYWGWKVSEKNNSTSTIPFYDYAICIAP
jgi:hypothetical protein